VVCTNVQILLANGAQVDLQNEDGLSALMIASMIGHSEVVERLLASGAQINLHNKIGMSALRIASQKGHGEVVKILLAKKANVLQENQNSSGNDSDMKKSTKVSLISKLVLIMK